MTDPAEIGEHAFGHFDGFAIFRWPQKPQGELGVFHSIQRQCRGMLRITLLVGVARFFFLQVRRVGQHDSQQIAGSGGREDGTTVALGDDPRQIAGVIDVRMGQHHRAQSRQVDGHGRPVFQAQFLKPLE